jgi:secreted trypsin-like serine protease
VLGALKESMRVPVAAVCALAAWAALGPALVSPPAADAIIGGHPAEAGAYPWLAHVSDFYGEWVGECTGTVVAPKLVLTAAHCVLDRSTGKVRDPAGFRVVTGAVDWLTGSRQELRVHGVVVAPEYDQRMHTHDAALLVLSTPTAAPAIALSRPRADAALLRAGTAASIVGWGDKAFGQRGPTPELQEAQTSVQHAAWCRQNAQPFDPASELCVIDPPREATGTCDGDSGGPLIVGAGAAEGEEASAIEVGILSGGYGHCATRRPSVYTRVDALYPWITGWNARLARR